MREAGGARGYRQRVGKWRVRDLTLIIDYRTEVLDAVLTLLERRVALSGNCQIGKRAMRTLVRDRFGITGQTAGNLLLYVLGFLEGKGIISFSHEHGQRPRGTNGSCENTIFNIHPDALHKR